MKPEIEKIPLHGNPDVVHRKRTTDEMNVAAAEGILPVTEQKITQVRTLTEKMQDAMNALDLAAGQYRVSTHQWIETELPAALVEIRNLRMATGSELSILLKLLGDLRTFFHGPTYEEEIARLREFTDLCERLKRLKDCGFLDDVADTMLRLSR